MSVIRFHTTHKGDLPHYSYIFSKTEPLGTEMKNVDCYRLGTMLHPDIQQGGGGYEDVEFSKRYLKECSVHDETSNG